jgi:hypothetical protein
MVQRDVDRYPIAPTWDWRSGDAAHTTRPAPRAHDRAMTASSAAGKTTASDNCSFTFPYAAPRGQRTCRDPLCQDPWHRRWIITLLTRRLTAECPFIS